MSEAPMTGNQYANLVATYVARSFGHRGITVYREVPFGKTLIGKNRRIDILVLEESSQARRSRSSASTRARWARPTRRSPTRSRISRSSGMPACLVYAGEGFSPGVAHMLAASPLTAYCLPDLRDLRSSEKRRASSTPPSRAPSAGGISWSRARRPLASDGRQVMG
jgi:hypothetical protein